MGRIKTRYIKVVSQKIYNMGEEKFSTNFDENKAAVTQYATIPSKKMRNSIVGYITRLKKQAE
ncbi:MAG: 30S ribosomal protein S17e [Nanoarchaeota archaeon]|nr:30S ribosomal protein S17e [Nanoarchaeota archaeon]